MRHCFVRSTRHMHFVRIKRSDCYSRFESSKLAYEQCSRSNCDVAECLPEKVNWCSNEKGRQMVKCKGLDTALLKKFTFTSKLAASLFLNLLTSVITIVTVELQRKSS